MILTPNRLPFSPLTMQGLDELRTLAAKRAATSLATGLRTTGGADDASVARALPFARLYDDMLDASVDRIRAMAEATR